MKKQLLTLAFAAMATVASYAQGTIAFGNSVGTAIRIVGDSVNPANHTMSAADQTRNNIAIGVFYGPSGSTAVAEQAVGTGVIGASAGVLASILGNNVLNLYSIPGSSPDGGTVVALEIRAWNTVTGDVYGRTGVREVTLGPAAGPAQVIWQGATATNPNRFTPLIVTIPEPSTIALGVLGLGGLLLFRRRQAK